MSGVNGILEVEYGEYPQTAVSKSLQDELESLYRCGGLKNFKRFFTTDSRKYDDYDHGFLAQQHTQYEYNGHKYVRVKANSCYRSDAFQLSNGEKYHNDDYVWVEVEPIKWLVDDKHDIALSKKIIFAGVQFNKERNYKGDFYSTDIKQFIDNYFSYEIIQNINSYDTENNFSKSISNRKSPYNFTYENISEEEIIRGAVESDIAVFLHGRSSEGKSARVKQIDPDCEIIYLRNATPDSLNGKSVYIDGTGMIDVPPTWFKKVCDKCEKEPDKLHIVFFDEITNALPSIQGMAFNIILDKEVNGIWKLPKNARIIAAGNDLNDSLSANDLAEPLFNRFAHVYIKTTVENWLEWAIKPKQEYKRIDYSEREDENKIHPAIYAFISYKGEKALRSEFNGERPNADPRKWEMASKMLYKTKNPEMLRALVGEEITRDFVSFCKQQVITLDDVINGNYTEQDFNMNLSSKTSTVAGLAFVDEENLVKVRDFVKNLGPEFVRLFDTLWIRGNDERLEKIAELRVENTHEGGFRK